MNISGVELVETCGACPEQYDAFIDGKLVGYLRLRHGHFTVHCPWAGGEEVYSAQPKGDGIFESDEREKHLTEAVEVIKAWFQIYRKDKDSAY